MTTESEPVAFSPDWLRKLKLLPWSSVAEWVAAAVAAWYVAHTLARLSGTALWVPKQWRDAIDIIVAALGSTVFYTVRTGIGIWNPAARDAIELAKQQQSRSVAASDHLPEHAAAPADEPTHTELVNAQHKARQKTLVILFGSVISLALALGALGLFMWLRSYCVKSFATQDWIATQDLQNQIDAKRDAAQLWATTHHHAASQPTTGLASQSNVPDSVVDAVGAVPPPQAKADDMLHIPPFVDRDGQEVYLPLWFPPGLKKDVDNLGKENGGNGVSLMLEKEPDYLFDSIETQASFQVTVTNWLFLLLDTTIVIFLAIGMAGTFDIPSTVGNVLGS